MGYRAQNVRNVPVVVPGQVVRVKMMVIESPNRLYRRVPIPTVVGTRLLPATSHRLPKF